MLYSERIVVHKNKCQWIPFWKQFCIVLFLVLQNWPAFLFPGWTELPLKFLMQQIKREVYFWLEPDIIRVEGGDGHGDEAEEEKHKSDSESLSVFKNEQ